MVLKSLRIPAICCTLDAWCTMYSFANHGAISEISGDCGSTIALCKNDFEDLCHSWTQRERTYGLPLKECKIAYWYLSPLTFIVWMNISESSEILELHFYNWGEAERVWGIFYFICLWAWWGDRVLTHLSQILQRGKILWSWNRVYVYSQCVSV